MRKIKNNLYISDLFPVKRDEVDEFDVVITLTKKNYGSTDYHFPLEDNNECEKELFNNAVKVLEENYPDKKVLVHCAVGKSRSPSVVAAFLKKENKQDVGKIINNIGGNPHPYLKNLAEDY